ncbi:MAG: ABC transporter [Marivirga sp.]|nr:ABC transporter [Marivirga sp.]
MSKGKILEIQNLTMQYKTTKTLVTALYDVSMDVHEGDRYVIVGPSGCGKSSLLKTIGGNIKPTNGTVKIGGKEIREPSMDVMNVFQGFDQLLPWKTVLENVMFPLVVGSRMDVKAAEEIALQFIDKVKLSKFTNSYPHELSGGMYTRVAIARGLAVDSKILLMDEPFAPLDALTRSHLQDELKALLAETGKTLLFITHDIPEAVKLGTRIAILSANPGQLVEEIQVLGSDSKELVARIGNLIQH